MNLHEAQHVHVIGIGGIGISALAKWSLEHGKQVSGSDVKENAMTSWLAEHGARVAIGPHRAANLPDPCDVAIFSMAVPAENPERRAAAERGMPCLSYPQAMDELLRAKVGIAVAGTHGKSTTTAMLAHILVHAQRDPSVIVGTRVRLFDDTNERFGVGEHLLIEADEFNQGILLYHPRYAVILNIDREHVDVYPTLADAQHAYQTFAGNVQANGMLVLNADDGSTRLMKEAAAAPVRTFGFHQADLTAHGVHVNASGTTFTVRGLYEGQVRLRVYGSHNVQNALAALCLAHALGVDFTSAAQALHDFPGTWRRFEQRGTWHGALLIDDYGHHPTELAATLDAARQVFPGKRLVVVFQPHTHSRTIAFAEQFALVLRRADLVVLTDVYDVTGRDRGEKANVQDIAAAIGPTAHVVKAVADAVTYLATRVQQGDVVLTIGAGDITSFADIAQKENPSV